MRVGGQAAVEKELIGRQVLTRYNNRVYRIDEIDSFFNSGPFVIAFAEYRPDKRTTLRLDAENAANVAGQRRRLFFSPNRTAPQPELAGFRQRNSHVKLILSLNRTF